ncbi:MAG: hypothetical protein ABIQ44_06275, partial [Chloroflexia bacterium]
AQKTDLQNRLHAAEAGVVRAAEETDAAFADRLAGARGKVLDLTRDAQDTAESYAERVQHALRDAQESAIDIATNIGDQVSAVSQKVSEAVKDVGAQVTASTNAIQQVGSNLASTITANPMLLGALGLAVGAILGALVPQSEAEEESLNEIASQARGGVTALAQNVLDQGGLVAGKMLDAGHDAASELGITSDQTIGKLTDAALSGDLVEAGKKVAHQLLKAGDEAVRE